MRNSTQCAGRRRSPDCGTRPNARGGGGVRIPLAPMRSAEMECGMRNSLRCAVRKRTPNPDGSFRRHSTSALRIGAELRTPHSISAPRIGPSSNPAFHFRTAHRGEFRTPDSISAPRIGASSELRIPCPHRASGRVPISAFHFRSPQWGELSTVPGSPTHHEHHPLRRGDIMRRITIDRDEIGVVSGRDRPDFIAQPERRGAR